jgi:predicted metal-binding protein
MIDFPEQLRTIALSCGFSHVGDLRVDTIRTREEVRATCAINTCRAYNASWSCPPACGTLAECEARIRIYRRGILLQTTGALEDSFDYEAMTRIGGEHQEHLAAFNRHLCALSPDARAIDALLLGAGACRRCETCAYPVPCRFPEEAFASMEAYGMVVSDVCQDNGLPYYYGPNTLTYVSCALFGV